MTIEIDQLAKAVAAHIAPAVPLHQTYWSARQVGAYLDVSPRQVTERYSTRPGFPAAKRIPTENGKGPLRWKASEIIAWLDKQ